MTATGGNSYVWSTGGSGPSISVDPYYTTIYDVTGTGSNGCTATASTTVVVKSAPNVSIATVASICPGQSTTLTASGGTSYVWSTGGSGPSISVDPYYTTPSVSVTNDGPVSCMKTSVTLTATGGDSYAWAGGGVAPTKVVTTPGNYTVTVTGYNGCTLSLIHICQQVRGLILYR